MGTICYTRIVTERAVLLATQIDIFILMAGRGARFKCDEFNLPKPLIKFKEMPLFTWSLKSIKDLLPIANLHLVICAEDNLQEKVELELTKLPDLNFHTVHIITIPNRTAGPLHTAVEAIRQTVAGNRNNLVIFGDCDLFFNSSSWMSAIKKLLAGESSNEGLLMTFGADSEKHSYVSVDENGFATGMAEKKVISKNAVVGFYAFKNSKLFLQTANKVLEGAPANSGEYFISQVYSELISAGKKIEVVEVDKLILLGTPEELEQSSHLDVPK